MIRKIRKKIEDSLGFSKTEANGTIILILLIIVIVIVPRIYLLKTAPAEESFPSDPEKLETWAKELENFISKTEKTRNESIADDREMIQKEFLFDPNTASAKELTALGFSSKAISSLIAYREAGGIFRVRSDLNKIYGISQERLLELHDFIDLPNKEEPKQIVATTKQARRERPPKKFDLNTADTTDFKKIYGIGPVLSRRIVAFREKLGGFHSPDQLYEIYGLDSVLVAALQDRSFIGNPHQTISLNTDSISQLYNHPYIDYDLARIIVNYRRQHGVYNSKDQVKKIKIISDSLYQKIYPYLSIDP